MTRQGFLIGFLAGGWLATIALILVFQVGLFELPRAQAEDPPTTGIPIPLPGTPGAAPGPGPTVNPSGVGSGARGLVNPGAGTSDSNNRAIALSASIGSGQSAVFYFDTVAQRLCVYQYETGSRGGLRLLAARMIGFDLKLEGYRDISEKTPREMREAWEAAMQPEGAGKGRRGGVLPTKHVDLPGSMR